MKLIVDNLKESWRPVYPLDFGVGSIETHPHLVQVIAPNEMVIYFRFNIRMRDTLSKMHFAIPMLVLEPIMHLFDRSFTPRRRSSATRRFLRSFEPRPLLSAWRRVTPCFR